MIKVDMPRPPVYIPVQSCYNYSRLYFEFCMDDIMYITRMQSIVCGHRFQVILTETVLKSESIFPAYLGVMLGSLSPCFVRE